MLAMGGDKAALIPSEFLRMVPKEGNKVQFVLVDDMKAEQFAAGK